MQINHILCKGYMFLEMGKKPYIWDFICYDPQPAT